MTPNALPLVSVVMPVHNGARWIAASLQSLFAQTFTDFEIVLVDDASSDDLSNVLAACADPRLRVIRFETNVGVSAARNAGIARAKGEYIAFCDADDLSLPERLATQYAYLQANPDVMGCGSAFICFDDQDRECVRHPTTFADIQRSMMRHNCFGLSTLMLRAKALADERFNPQLRAAEDYDLWLRLMVRGYKLVNLPSVLLRYRLHPQQASQAKSEKLDQTSRQLRALYCAQVLSLPVDAMQDPARPLTMADLRLAEQSIQSFCASHADYTPMDFRFMLAWMYQRQAHHGWQTWMQWRAIQKRLQLSLDRNYNLNVWVLACLPDAWKKKWFDVLIKLKR